VRVAKIANFDLALLCKFNPKKYPFLLESVVNNDINRYSILFAYPQQNIAINSIKSLKILEKDVNLRKKLKNELNLPFFGGYFCYFSYEFAGILEPSTKINTNNAELLACATYIPTAIIKDNYKKTTYIVDEENNIEDIKQDIKKLGCFENPIFNFKKEEEDEDIFKKSVDKTKKYIKNGDIFQANLSRNWNINLFDDVDDIEVYNALRNSNPAPFAAFVKFDDFSIISSSPERLFSVDNNVIQTRPIAGTRPRSFDANEDKKLKKELQSNLKEQAEHLMLLDLERNDLGRVCEYGSVEVDEVMTIESYEFVHHIVSNVKGKLKNNTQISDILLATFPGGTITGCPKIRSMQIIDELEKSPRKAYTGSVGYISNCGKMDFNILIRTMLKKNENISFRAGGGIVFDSIAKNELKETKHKAKGMLKVFEKSI
jgi:anthranilate synthase component 1